MDSKHDAVCGTYNLLLDEAIKNYRSITRSGLSSRVNSLQSNSSLQCIKTSNEKRAEELVKIRMIKSSEDKYPKVSLVESENVLHSEEQQFNQQSGRDKFSILCNFCRKSCSLLMKGFRRQNFSYLTDFVIFYYFLYDIFSSNKLSINYKRLFIIQVSIIQVISYLNLQKKEISYFKLWQS